MDGSTTDGQTLGPVVAGADGSDHAARAVLWAADEAAVRQQSLTIVHAIGLDQALSLAYDNSHAVLSRARTILDEVTAQVSRLHPELSVSTVVTREEAAESLLEAAGETARSWSAPADSAVSRPCSWARPASAPPPAPRGP